MNSTIQKQSFQSAWKILLPSLLPLPITVLSVVCRTWHGCPSKPHLLQLTADTWSAEKGYWVTTVHPARHSCASTKALLCSEQQETQAWIQEASLSFNNQGLQVAIPLLLLCAPGCCHFCLCSEIRKATSTCREITVLMILCSSTSSYACFPGSKCLSASEIENTSWFLYKSSLLFPSWNYNLWLQFQVCFSIERCKVIFLMENYFKLNF